MELQPVPNWGTIPRMLRDQAANHPGADVVHTAEVTLTLAELRAQAGEVARGLVALGLETGDRVGIWAPNTPSWVVAAYGLWDAGSCVAPVSTRFKGLEAGRRHRKARAEAPRVCAGLLGAPVRALGP